MKRLNTRHQTHLLGPRNDGRFLCGYKSKVASTSTDLSQVTCLRCQRARAAQFGQAGQIDIEKMAGLVHAMWAGWMRYLFSKCTPCGGRLIIPRWAVERWTRQLSLDYSLLSEEEKDSDRSEARRIADCVS